MNLNNQIKKEIERIKKQKTDIIFSKNSVKFSNAFGKGTIPIDKNSKSGNSRTSEFGG